MRRSVTRTLKVKGDICVWELYILLSEESMVCFARCCLKVQSRLYRLMAIETSVDSRSSYSSLGYRSNVVLEVKCELARFIGVVECYRIGRGAASSNACPDERL